MGRVRVDPPDAGGKHSESPYRRASRCLPLRSMSLRRSSALVVQTNEAQYPAVEARWALLRYTGLTKLRGGPMDRADRHGLQHAIRASGAELIPLPTATLQ